MIIKVRGKFSIKHNKEQPILTPNLDLHTHETNYLDGTNLKITMDWDTMIATIESNRDFVVNFDEPVGIEFE